MRKTALILVVALLFPSTLVFAQAGRKPAPATRKPAPPAPATTPAPAAKPIPPPPPPPSDVRFKSVYTTGDQITESVTSISGTRERYDLGSMVLIRQHDLKRTVQISVAANTYLISPDVESAAAAPSGSGVIVVETSIADVGERKTIFGHEARRVLTVLDRQPQPGACDQVKQRIETDGWYIDSPKALSAQPPNMLPPSAAACQDEVKVNRTGDAALIGFPVSYSTSIPGADGKPVVMKMEVAEFEVTNLDASLFEIPSGMTEVTSGRDLAKSVSDANEVKLAAAPAAASAPPKKPGVVRVAVPELANKTTQQVDTRALRTQLISELTEQKVEAIPLAAAAQADLDAHAKELGCDYLLMAQITELKASKPGRLGRLVKKTAGESTDKDVTEAKLSVQLVPVGAAKPRMSTTTEGNDGGIGFKTGLRLARAAAMMYLRYASPLAAMNSMQMMNLGGMGMLGNPMLMQMQGAGVMGTGRSLDRTAGAAMFMMDAMASGSSSGASEGPSFDASLAEAIEGAAKKTRESVSR
jgi:hypothetical protein